MKTKNLILPNCEFIVGCSGYPISLIDIVGVYNIIYENNSFIVERFIKALKDISPELSKQLQAKPLRNRGSIFYIKNCNSLSDPKEIDVNNFKILRLMKKIFECSFERKNSFYVIRVEAATEALNNINEFLIKFDESTKAKAYTQGAAAGVFKSKRLPPEIGSHIGTFLKREDGRSLALTNREGSRKAKEHESLIKDEDKLDFEDQPKALGKK